MEETAIKKFVNFFWGEPQEEDYEQVDNEVEYVTEGYEEEEEQESSSPLNLFKSRNKVVSMPQPQQIQMKIAKPTNFDQAYDIVTQLKQKNAIIINLEYVSKDVARRIIDVVTGAVQALDGNMEKVSNSIFVVAPYNYDIINEATKEKIESKFSASWIK